MNIQPDFERSDGLIPAIAQDFTTGDVPMLAWMNRQAWEMTRHEGVAVYWSRSRVIRKYPNH